MDVCPYYLDGKFSDVNYVRPDVSRLCCLEMQYRRDRHLFLIAFLHLRHLERSRSMAQALAGQAGSPGRDHLYNSGNRFI